MVGADGSPRLGREGTRREPFNGFVEHLVDGLTDDLFDLGIDTDPEDVGLAAADAFLLDGGSCSVFESQVHADVVPDGGEKVEPELMDISLEHGSAGGMAVAFDDGIVTGKRCQGATG
jgi:hypothetical protein